MRSARGRSSLALCRVVTMRSLTNREASWLLNIARRCPVVRPSLRPKRLCCMSGSPSPASGARPGAAGVVHPEGEPEPAQQLLQLLERLLAEVLDLEDL